MKKHIKSEHKVAKYELDLHKALIFLSEEEVEQLKTMVQPRQERFGESGLLETNTNIFKVKESTSSSKVALPDVPVNVIKIYSRTSTVDKDHCASKHQVILTEEAAQD